MSHETRDESHALAGLNVRDRLQCDGNRDGDVTLDQADQRPRSLGRVRERYRNLERLVVQVHRKMTDDYRKEAGRIRVLRRARDNRSHRFAWQMWRNPLDP